MKLKYVYYVLLYLWTKNAPNRVLVFPVVVPSQACLR